MRHLPRVAGMALCNTSFYLGARATLLPAVSAIMGWLPASLIVRSAASQMDRLLATAREADFWKQFYQEELSLPGAGERLKHQFVLIGKLAAFFRHNPIPPNTIPVRIIAAEDDRGFTKREIPAIEDHDLSARHRSLKFPHPPAGIRGYGPLLA